MFLNPDLSVLPDLPQKRRLMAVVNDLWQDPQVVALWLGGSLARGVGDSYSDVDLRVAIRPEAFIPDQLPDSAQQLQEESVAHLTFKFGSDATLHHMLLHDGEFYDLFVQTTKRDPSNEARCVIACRDQTFGKKLSGGKDPLVRFPPADATTVRRLIVSFWMSQQKHLRVLYRGLPLLLWEGEHRMRQDLIRLWYAQASGYDCGPVHALTIHTFSAVARVLNELVGKSALDLVGQALSTEREITAAATRLQDALAHIGRQLAEQLGFDYPVALEETVRESWRRFLTVREPGACR